MPTETHPSWWRRQSRNNVNQHGPLTSTEWIRFVVAFLVSAVPIIGPLLIAVTLRLLPRIRVRLRAILVLWFVSLCATLISVAWSGFTISGGAIRFVGGFSDHLAILISSHVLQFIVLWLVIYAGVAEHYQNASQVRRIRDGHELQRLDSGETLRPSSPTGSHLSDASTLRDEPHTQTRFKLWMLWREPRTPTTTSRRRSRPPRPSVTIPQVHLHDDQGSASSASPVGGSSATRRTFHV